MLEPEGVVLGRLGHIELSRFGWSAGLSWIDARRTSWAEPGIGEG